MIAPYIGAHDPGGKNSCPVSVNPYEERTLKLQTKINHSHAVETDTYFGKRLFGTCASNHEFTTFPDLISSKTIINFDIVSGDAIEGVFICQKLTDLAPIVGDVVVQRATLRVTRI